MIIAVTLPHAFGARGLLFAITYVAIQTGKPLILLIAHRDVERHSPARHLCWATLSAVPWIAGAALFPQSPARGALWTLAIALDYAGLVFGWPVPKLGRTGAEDWRMAGEHLAERYQQLIVITIGETILLTGAAFADAFTPDRVAPTVLSFATAVLMWRIYFHRAGAVFSAAIGVAARPDKLGKSGYYTQLVIVTGILAAGVGYALVIREPRGHQDPLWLAVILGGPALFLAGRSRIGVRGVLPAVPVPGDRTGRTRRRGPGADAPHADVRRRCRHRRPRRGGAVGREARAPEPRRGAVTAAVGDQPASRATNLSLTRFRVAR